MLEYAYDFLKIGVGTLIGYAIYRYFKYCKRWAAYEKIFEGIPEVGGFERWGFGRYIKVDQEQFKKYGGEDFLQRSIKGTHRVCGQDGLRSVTKYRIMPFIASPYLVITDRHVIERILKTPGNINRMDVRADRIMFGNTLVSSNGDDWKQRRRIMAKSFHMDMLATYHDGINNQCQEMVACFKRQLASKDSINVMFRKYALAVSIDIAGEILFGQSFSIQETLHQTGEYPSWAKCVTDYISIVGVALSQLHFGERFFKMTAPDNYKRMTQSKTEFKEYMKVLAERRREQIRTDPGAVAATGSKLSIIDQILKLNDEEKLNEEDMLSELLLFFVGGSDTSQNALSDGLCHLMQPRNKHVVEKLRLEVDGKCPDDSDVFISHGDIDQMPYLDAVVREILRIAAPFPWTGRMLEQPVKLSDDFTFNASKELPVFTLMGLHAINYDTELWGEDVEEFRPERHFDVDKSTAVPAFSYGQRNCIGKNMAMSSLKLEIAYLVKYFDIECTEEVLGRTMESTLTSLARKFVEEPSLKFSLRK